MPLGGFADRAPALRETAERRVGMPNPATLPARKMISPAGHKMPSESHVS